MSNTHTKTRTSKKLSSHMLMGYQDRVALKPYRPAYERWLEHQQQRYEGGRECAGHMLAAGSAPPLTSCTPTREWWIAFNASEAPVWVSRMARGYAAPAEDITFAATLDRRGKPLPVPEFAPPVPKPIAAPRPAPVVAARPAKPVQLGFDL